MAFYITRPGAVNPSTTVYYTGGNSWSDNPADKVTMTEAEANALLPNPDGKNGGFKNATVVEE